MTGKRLTFFLFAWSVVGAQAEKSAKDPTVKKTEPTVKKTEPQEPKHTAKKEPQEPPPAKRDPVSTAKPVVKATGKVPSGNSVTFDHVDTITERFSLAYDLFQTLIPFDQETVFQPVREALKYAPSVGNQVYEQVSNAVTTHGPTVKQSVVDSLGACEVGILQARSLSATLYKENVGPHLDPHLKTASEIYDQNLRAHVDTAYQVYSDVHPTLSQHASDAYDITKTIVGGTCSQLSDHVFTDLAPAFQIGAEQTLGTLKYYTSILFHPVKMQLHHKELIFPYGSLDIGFTLVYGIAATVLIFILLRFSLRQGFRLTRKLFSWSMQLVKSLLFLIYFLLVKLALGLIFLALRIVTLNYLCMCCGLCSKRKKKRVGKVVTKNVDSKTKSATSIATDKSAPPKKLPPPPMAPVSSGSIPSVASIPTPTNNASKNKKK